MTLRGQTKPLQCSTCELCSCVSRFGVRIMAFIAKKAARSRRPLKISMEGLSGAGKTYTALRIAFDMRRNGIGKRIIVLDSENESASLYAGTVEDGERWDYEVADIPPESRNPSGYAEAYEWAVKEGYDIIIVDSLSHAWHGALELVDQFARSNRGDKMGGWANLSPQQRNMITTLTDKRAHCISTMRVKADFQDVEVNGRTRKQKVGLKADQRESTEYEYDLVLRFESGNEVFVEKVRGCKAMNGKSFVRPGPSFWKPLFDWWKEAPDEPVVQQQPTPATQAPVISKERHDAIAYLFEQATTTEQLVAAWKSMDNSERADPRVIAVKDKRKAELAAVPAAG